MDDECDPDEGSDFTPDYSDDDDAEGIQAMMAPTNKKKKQHRAKKKKRAAPPPQDPTISSETIAYPVPITPINHTEAVADMECSMEIEFGPRQ